MQMKMKLKMTREGRKLPGAGKHGCGRQRWWKVAVTAAAVTAAAVSFLLSCLLSNVYKRTIVLRSGIHFTCKFIPRILKDKQNKIFVVFEILINVLLTLINWLLKPKCKLKLFFV